MAGVLDAFTSPSAVFLADPGLQGLGPRWRHDSPDGRAYKFVAPARPSRGLLGGHWTDARLALMRNLQWVRVRPGSSQRRIYHYVVSL